MIFTWNKAEENARPVIFAIEDAPLVVILVPILPPYQRPNVPVK